MKSICQQNKKQNQVKKGEKGNDWYVQNTPGFSSGVAKGEARGHFKMGPEIDLIF